MRHLRAILFDARVHDKWSYEQLPMVQRIMNTVEKNSTGVTSAELVLNNSIRLLAIGHIGYLGRTSAHPPYSNPATI